jgi:hypothetical protein
VEGEIERKEVWVWCRDEGFLLVASNVVLSAELMEARWYVLGVDDGSFQGL